MHVFTFTILPTFTHNCLPLCRYKEKVMYKERVMEPNPDSYVEIDSHEARVVKLFVRYKTCIDGFIVGYLNIIIFKIT